MHRIVLPIYVALFYAVFVLVKLFTWLGIPKQRRSVNIKRVLFLESMGPPSAGFRFRSNGWAERLSHQGVQVDVAVALDYRTQLRWSKSKTGMLFLHLVYLLKRVYQVFVSARYDAMIVRREVLLYNDYGNLFFEKWMRRIHHNLMLDVDDDISAAKHEPRVVALFGKLMLEHTAKFRASLDYYDKVIVASNYLRDRLTPWCDRNIEVLVLPTCVDVNKLPRKQYVDGNQTIVIGWVGSSNNYSDLYEANDALKKLCNHATVEVLIVSDAVPLQAAFPFTFARWSVEREHECFLKIDVGIMPVRDDAEGRGKAGLKLIQYMSHGIVSVASAVSVNNEIVEDNVDGFLVRDKNDWHDVLLNVISNQPSFSRIGNAAVAKVAARYTYDTHAARLFRFIGVDPVETSEATSVFSPTHGTTK